MTIALCECGCGEPAPIATNTNGPQRRIKGQPLRYVRGHNGRGKLREQHQSWLGDDATYWGIHKWLQRNKERTGICQACGRQPPPYAGRSTGTDFANVSGEYRRDADDYVELCRSCHIAFDGRSKGRTVEVLQPGT